MQLILCKFLKQIVKRINEWWIKVELADLFTNTICRHQSFQWNDMPNDVWRYDKDYILEFMIKLILDKSCWTFSVGAGMPSLIGGWLNQGNTIAD